ncbi:helix-turn-helix transcriptional regulator [Actinoplanes solisilvae]|uniref:helix-turn-helix transcriptional regulator n=1 Tax=Actinoplanes solisilvae TaxID=2486853 RepID=UPI000FDB0F07|nr:LuxR family transcriptional regulator [Actinoplanes solisilvae]
MGELLPGRAQDLAAIRAFVDQATVHGGARLLIGQPGVGKSVLLDAAARYAATTGARILRTGPGAIPLGQKPVLGDAPDHAALDRLLAPLHDDLAALPPASRDALRVALGLADGPAPDRLSVSDAALRLLRHVAEGRPLLVLVEDTNDLDRASALVFAFVARRLGGSRVAMLLAARDPYGYGLLNTAGLPEQPVQPLDDAAAAEMLRSRHPDMDARVRDRVVAEAAGNSRALVEFPAALTDRQRTGADPLPAVLPLTDFVHNALQIYLSALPAETRHVLLLVALEGHGDLITIQGAAPHLDLLTTIAPAESRHVVYVDEASRRIAFSHATFRAAAQLQATDLEHRRAHRALAAVLAYDPDRHLAHLAAATRGTDEALAERLRAGAERSIRRGEPVAAAEALARAAELSPRPADRARRLLEAAFLRADVTGDLRDAARLLDRARAAGTDLAGSLPVALVVAHVALNGGLDVDAVRRVLTPAVEAYTANADASDEMLIEALNLMLMNAWFSGRPEAWAPFERAVARLRPQAPPDLELAAQAFGDATRLTPELLKTVDDAVGRLSDELNPIAVTRTALACVYTDRLAACREPLARVVRDARRAGAAALAVHAIVSSCNDLWQSGQWTELDALAREGAELCEAHGIRGSQLILTGYHRALAAVARGDTDAGRLAARRMADDGAAHGALLTAQFAAHVHALAAIGDGDFDEAYRQAASVAAPGTLPAHTPHALWVLPELVEGAVRSGREAEARAHVDALRAGGIGAISARLEMVVDGCAGLAFDDGEAYEMAVAVPDAERWPFDLARVRLAYGRHLRRHRRGATARIQLTAALEVFERLGARGWIRHTAGELRAGGLPIAGPGRGEWLSPQERRIAELAAAGLSNKQIAERLRVSHRTVGGHLHRIFPKLGVTSRAALRDALDRG